MVESKDRGGWGGQGVVGSRGGGGQGVRGWVGGEFRGGGV